MTEGSETAFVNEALDSDEAMRRSGNLVYANALELPPAAVSVRVRDGKMSATDGPFAETKEHLSGFIIIEARDLNEAIRLAGDIPMAAARHDRGAAGARARAHGAEALRLEQHAGAAIAGRLEAVYRSNSRRVLATLIRLLGDFERAEEALDDAFAAAAEQWPRDGMPANPFAWLVSAGRFRAIDRLRRKARLDASLKELAMQFEDEAAEPEMLDERPSRTTSCG